MRSMYADYVHETRDVISHETEKGFATYRIVGDECYIEDIYVRPEFRSAKAGTEIADAVAQWAKQLGCKYLAGTVNTLIKDPTASTKALLSYGFKIAGATNNVIIFKMELE